MKVISMLVAVACLIFGATASAQPKPLEFMFVIDSAHGELVHLDGKQFQLRVPIRDIKSVLAFSDRPHRKNFRLSETDYAKLVYIGKNSFSDNPPNIALVWADQKTHTEVYMLKGYKKTQESIIYSLEWQPPSDPISSIKSSQGRVALFIDPLEINEIGVCMPVVQHAAPAHIKSISALKERVRVEVRQVIMKQAKVCSFER